jgi:hypothetical protein
VSPRDVYIGKSPPPGGKSENVFFGKKFKLGKRIKGICESKRRKDKRQGEN